MTADTTEFDPRNANYEVAILRLDEYDYKNGIIQKEIVYDPSERINSDPSELNIPRSVIKAERVVFGNGEFKSIVTVSKLHTSEDELFQVHVYGERRDINPLLLANTNQLLFHNCVVNHNLSNPNDKSWWKEILWPENWHIQVVT